MLMIDQDYIRHIATYDPETGEFVRIKKKSWTGNWYNCHSVPKSITEYGYFQMNVNGRPYVIHRLIWLWMTGEWPDDIDHIDGDRQNNKWKNLRSISRQENLKNMGIKSTNTSGVTGVSFNNQSKKWQAYIHSEKRKRKHLGYFESIEDAITARLKAEKKYGYHENHGRRNSWQG
jgi:hypothetical protein